MLKETRIKKYLINLEFDMLYLWEHKLKTKQNVCKEMIIKFIGNGKN